MARVAFPSYDVPAIGGRGGGAGTFVTQFARMLSEAGDEVTIIHASGATEIKPIDQEFLDRYRSWGIEVIQVHNTSFNPKRSPDVWVMRLSEQVAPVVRNFDIAYFADWGNLGFHTVRQKRFASKPMPVCVNVLHGSSTWVQLGDRELPLVPDHLNIEFVERYTAALADFIVSPSRRLVSFVEQQGWTFRRPPEILGLPIRPAVSADTPPPIAVIKRLVFFGRIEKRKGYDILVKALMLLWEQSPELLRQLAEIMFLGHERDPGAIAGIRRELAPTGLAIRHIGFLDVENANAYLRTQVPDALVVVPSPRENFPYAVIECSLIPGLNLICTRGGGTPEIFAGGGEAQLFDPDPWSLATMIRERITKPLSAAQLARYDFEGANKRWLSFHEGVRAAVKKSLPARNPATPAVDVCVTYFNKARHFPQLCESLGHQTYSNFRVIAVDDGSTDREAIHIFAEMGKKYESKGWIFFRQSNQFVDAARNSVARRASAEFLLMLDADDCIAPNAIKSLVAAALESGVDCLISGTCFFKGDGLPYDPKTGEMTIQPTNWCMPLGPSLLSGMIDPVVFGGHMILIRRAVFEAIGGYREVRNAGHEDWELHARLALAGYRTDVFPEYLHFYRQADDSLSRRLDRFTAKRRMIEAYDQAFGKVGLYGTANVVWSLYQRSKDLEGRLIEAERRLQLDAPGRRRPKVDQLDAPGRRRPKLDQRVTVLVLIPTLQLGGAEMDIVRSSPRFDRERFQLTVCTFLEAGELTPMLAAEGIEVIGPDFPGCLSGLTAAALRFLRSVTDLLPQRLSRGLRAAAKYARPGARAVYRVVKLVLSAIAFVLRSVPKRFRGVLLGPPNYIRLAIKISCLIRSRNFDVIYTILPNAYVAGMLANLMAGKRPLVMSRVSSNWYHQDNVGLRRFERFLHRWVDLAVGNSTEILEDLRNEGLAPSQLRLVRNGIDTRGFLNETVDRSVARNRFRIPPDALVFVYVANLFPEKGHNDLLRALHLVAGDLPDMWQLLLPGRDVDGSVARLQSLAEELGLARHVRLLGPRMDVPSILSTADIYVCPSRREGLPNNLLEAMCVGLPVVATEVGGIPELVEDGQSGLLVPPADPPRLGGALRLLAFDPDRRASLGSAAAARVRADFSIEGHVATYQTIFSELAPRSVR